jgi:hypothetical protein
VWPCISRGVGEGDCGFNNGEAALFSNSEAIALFQGNTVKNSVHHPGFLFNIQQFRPGGRFFKRTSQFIDIHNRRRDTIVALGAAFIEFIEKSDQQRFPDSLLLVKCFKAFGCNESDIVFKLLIGLEGVMLPASLPMPFPFLARLVLLTVPTELDTYFFYRAGYKRTTDGHPLRALAPAALTGGLGLIARAQFTEKPADSYFRIENFHLRFIIAIVDC